MKIHGIMMPMRKPPEEVTDEERKVVYTWMETQEVPETVVEAARIMLIREQAQHEEQQ